MKRIGPRTDIKFKLSDFKGLTPNFKIRFFTTNQTFYVEKTQNDVTDDYIKLNWSELQTIGKGVMNYTLFTYQTDEDFDDGVFDNSYSRTTDYYIMSSVDVGDDGQTTSMAEILADLQERTTEIERDTEEIDRVVSEALNDLNTRLVAIEQ